MQKTIGLMFVAAALAATLAHSGVAHAKDGLAGSFGGGMSGGITGGAGAHASYRIMDQLGVSASFGFFNFDPRADGVDSTGGLVIGARGFYNFYVRENTHLGAVLGLGFGTGNIGLTRIQVGLRPEIFVTDYLAIHAAFGLGVVLTSEDSAFTKGTFVTVGGGGFGSFGFTFYFGQATTTKKDDEDDFDDYDFDF